MKRTPKKLKLSVETIQSLQSDQLSRVVGGFVPTQACPTFLCPTPKCVSHNTTVGPASLYLQLCG